MSVFAICSESIDWSAMGSMLGGIASFGTFFIALYALKTWKRDIELQDRYEKVERLINAYFLCMEAGGKWQMACGASENRDIAKEGESLSSWLSAHWQYQKSWHSVRPLLNEAIDPDELFLPENISKNIVKAGDYLASSEESELFIRDMDALYQNGFSAIYALRNAP